MRDELLARTETRGDADRRSGARSRPRSSPTCVDAERGRRHPHARRPARGVSRDAPRLPARRARERLGDAVLARRRDVGRQVRQSRRLAPPQFGRPGVARDHRVPPARSRAPRSPRFVASTSTASYDCLSSAATSKSSAARPVRASRSSTARPSSFSIAWDWRRSRICRRSRSSCRRSRPRNELADEIRRRLRRL